MRSRFRWAAIAAAMTMVSTLVLPVSAEAATCTPSVSLDQPYIDASRVVHFVAHYQTCGPEMALKLKSRVYHEGRYEFFISGPVSGAGQTEFLEGPTCSPYPAVKMQYLYALKIGAVLYAKSAPKTYTYPLRPCT
jgi:hypothetical protein